MHKFGKLTGRPAVFDTVQMIDDVETVVATKTVMALFDANGEVWHDLFRRFPATETSRYIAVDDNGAIVSMEADPEHSQLEGYDIWLIDEDYGFSRGPGGTVYGKYWNGTAITETPPE